MNLTNKIVATLVAVFCLTAAHADDAKSLRLSEVSLGDGSGKGGWIEIQNTSWSTGNIGGFYITNKQELLKPELSAPDRIAKMHFIPTGNPATEVAPQNCIVLIADGQDNLGILHTDFTLQAGDIVAIYSANGVDLVDSLTIPEYLAPEQSWAKDFDKNKWKVCERPTPTQANDYEQAKKNNKIAEFKEKDPYGIAMAVMAMGVVFSCLLLLYLFFKFFGKLFARNSEADNKADKLHASQQKNDNNEAAVAALMAVTEATAGSGDEDLDVALIALALEAELAHDEESGVITIAAAPSPWADKGLQIAAGTLHV